MKYKVYAGMAGGFNDVCLRMVEEFKSRDEALRVAESYARDEFESYAGLHGVRDWDECLDEADGDEDLAQQIYEEEFEEWTDYYVMEDDGVEEEIYE